jgi:hypothetical protein
MRKSVVNTDKFLLSFENDTFEVIDLENDKRLLVEKVYYHDTNELYLFKIDGIIMHNFILDDETVAWMEDKIEIF